MEIELIENKRTQRRNIPYDTGKVKIGLTHTPKPPKMDAHDELIQAMLLGIEPWEDKLVRDALLYIATIVAVLFFLLVWTVVRGGTIHG
jgi:hypothetical protein